MTIQETRWFNVRLGDRPSHGGRRLSEVSHEAAGVAFAEDWAPHADAGGEVAVIVRDEDTGIERCFRVELATGEAEPCAPG
jgi:hypothetical protein